MAYIDDVYKRLIPILKVNSALENRDPIWEWCNNFHSKEALTKENFENMAQTDLTIGFFGGADPRHRPTHEVNRNAIIKLAEATGVRGIHDPEGTGKLIPRVNTTEYTDSELLRKIEKAFGFNIHLPPFIGGRDVTETDYGIIDYRQCYYLWILKRVMELCPDKNSSILEIGAGMGILGYYLDRAGYKDYTTIDLAQANACQAYFMAKNLPERDLLLSGERDYPFHWLHRDSLKILHTTDFNNIPKNRFELIVNMDSLTEMRIEEATKYMQSDCAPLFLSINHEVNNYRAIDIYKPARKLIYRYPFWIREGYVEELYQM